MALIEIDGLPINSMVIFHGYVSHNMSCPFIDGLPIKKVILHGYVSHNMS